MNQASKIFVAVHRAIVYSVPRRRRLQQQGNIAKLTFTSTDAKCENHHKLLKPYGHCDL